MTQNYATVIDTERNNLEFIEVSREFPFGKIYRDSNTRSLDEEFGKYLSKETPFLIIPNGSSFKEEGLILGHLDEFANITGFYFGVPKKILDSRYYGSL